MTPGKNAQGYWTNADLVKQLREKVIPIFKILHPFSHALIMFDNSQNHHALSPDALNLSDGGVNTKLQRSGWFINESGVKIIQQMQNPAGVQKGVRSILMERGLWDRTLSLKAAREILQSQPDFQEQREWLAEVVGENDGFIIRLFIQNSTVSLIS